MKRLTMLLLTLAAACAQAETFTGRVVGVADGDTITVLDSANVQHKIRLAGIDCPEKNQPYGQAAKQSMSDQVFDRQVSIETSKLDHYGRQIGKVLVGNVDANLEQVKHGLAWHYKKYEREQSIEDRAAYANAEIEARAAGRGLWSDPAPMSPWDWRHRVK
jgi:endonuclease YncB( thermonuclease family)